MLAGVRVVTVTGPNTGGKTASLKALGLAALMPKAGLFLPLEPPPGKGPPTPIFRSPGVLGGLSHASRHCHVPAALYRVGRIRRITSEPAD